MSCSRGSGACSAAQVWRYAVGGMPEKVGKAGRALLLTSRAGMLERCVLLPRKWRLQCSAAVEVWGWCVLENLEAAQGVIPVKQQSRAAQRRHLAPAEVAPAGQHRVGCGRVGLLRCQLVWKLRRWSRFEQQHSTPGVELELQYGVLHGARSAGWGATRLGTQTAQKYEQVWQHRTAGTFSRKRHQRHRMIVQLMRKNPCRRHLDA